MNNDLTIEFTDRLVVVTCWCGINHAVPQQLRDLQQRQHRDGQTVTSIYCPLGHRHLPAGIGEAEKLRKQLEAERRRASSSLAALDQERASHRSTKGQLTKAKKRAQNGVCPCCHRSFVQLTRHMKVKHPNFEPGDFT